MLQKVNSDSSLVAEGGAESLDLSYYYSVLKKRALYLLLPFVVTLAAGFGGAILWPPTYLSEGKILVESQQIPTDLVRPTVTTTAKERIQVIQQRVTTRENLLAIADKYKMYADRRDRLSRTELLDLMRENIKVEPVDLDPGRGRRTDTIAVTVGFMDRRADVATKVANELLTLFLNEDARNRTNRAVDTTKFLGREAQRLEGEVSAVDAKIAEFRQQQQQQLQSGLTVQQPGAPVSPLAAAKAELAMKRAIYTKSHPEIRRLQGQVEALEKLAASTSAAPTSAATTTSAQVGNNLAASEALEPLLARRASAQKDLEAATQKLAAARLGESLERDQFSERLEVLEQAVLPQKPIKPNRPKLLALALFAAMAAGVGCVFLIESFDKTIRGTRDLMRVADGNLLVTLPYITTTSELSQRKKRIWGFALLGLLAIAASLAAVHFLVRPLDDLWTLFLIRLLGSVQFG